MEEIYDIIELVVSNVLNILTPEGLGVKKVLYGPLITSKLKSLPIVWIIPDNLSFEAEEMHMDLYRYNIDLLVLIKPRTILKNPMEGASLVAKAFKLIRDGFKSKPETRAYVQNIRLQKLDYIGDEIREKNLFITSGQISFLIRSKP
ncbi:MAG: hypothetical protein AB7D08_04660 [Bacteroidales bacterium]